MSGTPLKSLSEIFESRVFRVPDYQRGYAWEEKELNDLWNDLDNLPVEPGTTSGRRHYMGMLTLKQVDEAEWRGWAADPWLIERREYRPFHVVDGQQRLVTLVILLDAIAKRVRDGAALLDQTRDMLLEKYVRAVKPTDRQPSFLIGYAPDDPSDEFLVRHVFEVADHRHSDVRTLYTANLQRTGESCRRRLDALDDSGLEDLLRKVTKRLVFNVHELEDELDVCISFETMNNRGRPLSTLELLKNRLVYLSTQIPADDGDRRSLRWDVTRTWKTIYEYLGKDPDVRLDDDRLLRTHAIAWFGADAARDFAHHLLASTFTLARARAGELELAEIRAYLSSLQEAAGWWHAMHSPRKAEVSAEVRTWLEKLQRLNRGDLQPLVLAVLMTTGGEGPGLLLFLQTCERLGFLAYDVSGHRTNKGRSFFFSKAHAQLRRRQTLAALQAELQTKLDRWGGKIAAFRSTMDDLFSDSEGWYSWSGRRYLLFEYELDLRERKREIAERVDWRDVTRHPKDQVSIEHVFPREAVDASWQEVFGDLDPTHQRALLHSLGNLLLLRQPKNSHLTNKPFLAKRDGVAGGPSYRYGSFSEIEVAEEQTWTPDTIRARGLRLLDFMERRWDLPLGDESDKLRLLGLSYLSTAAPTPVAGPAVGE